MNTSNERRKLLEKRTTCAGGAYITVAVVP